MSGSFERGLQAYEDGYKDALAYAVAMCIEMAERYDQDIEGCDGEELISYSEGIACAHRLADWLYSRKPLEPLKKPYPKQYVPKKIGETA